MPLQAGEQQPEQEKNQEQRTATDAGLDVARFPRGPAGAALVAYHLHILPIRFSLSFWFEWRVT